MDDADVDKRAADASRDRPWLEVAAVLSLAVIPWLFSSTVIVLDLDISLAAFTYDQLSLIVTSIAIIVPVLLVISLTDDWEAVGLVRPRPLLDVSFGVGLYLLGTMAWYLAVWYLPISAWPEEPYEFPNSDSRDLLFYLLLLCGSIANGVAEEIVMRGFLITRLERLLNSTWLAVLISTGLFAGYHLYQGVGPAICTGALGLIYAIAFIGFRRLWPLFVAHAIADFVPYFWM